VSGPDPDYEDFWKPPAFLKGPLFDTKGEWLEVADLDWGEEYHYVEGYRAAARLAAKEATSYPGEADKFVYPVVTLYRHAIELLLKRIISYQETPETTHNLHDLWKRAVVVIEAEDAEISPDQVAAVGKRIMELHAKDKPATRFRYAGGGDRKKSLKGGFNVATFGERAESLCDVLDAWDTAIHEHRNWRYEMEAEYRDYNQPDYGMP
jgi:hypothetical protein